MRIAHAEGELMTESVLKFNLDMDMYLIEEDRKFSIRKLRDLLPMAFTPKELSEGQRSTG